QPWHRCSSCLWLSSMLVRCTVAGLEQNWHFTPRPSQVPRPHLPAFTRLTEPWHPARLSGATAVSAVVRRHPHATTGATAVSAVLPPPSPRRAGGSSRPAGRPPRRPPC